MPFAICCEGSIGACSADIAVEADGPDEGVLTACGRAVVMPVAGSALPGGQRPLVGFFRAAQLPASDVAGVLPFVWAEEADTVDVEELEDAIDEDEFCLCAVLRGPGANILVASSEFIAPNPLPLAAVLHPNLVLG